VTELHASDRSVVWTITDSGQPTAVASNGTVVWVTNANTNANTVSVLNASDGSVVQTIPVGLDPSAVSFDGTHVWVANQGDTTVSEIALNFAIVISSLPSATPGTAYGPVTLQAVNLGTSTSPYTTTLKWKKISLPKGLKLSMAGVLSGKPSSRLAAGPSSVTVQVTETVTTLNGRRKVKTPTTVEATIPLTIT
jgi:DNA-binding beta-propeller fold protein YncE